MLTKEYKDAKVECLQPFIKEQYDKAIESFRELINRFPEVFQNYDDNKDNSKEYLTVFLNILKCYDYFRKKEPESFDEKDFNDKCEDYIMVFDKHVNGENLSTKPTIEYFVIITEYYLSLASSKGEKNYYDEVYRIYKIIFKKFLPKNRLELIQRWLMAISESEFYFFANGLANVLLDHCYAIRDNKEFFCISENENNEILIKEVDYCKGKLLDLIAEVRFFKNMDFSDSDYLNEILILLDESLDINKNDILAQELKKRVIYLRGIKEQISRFRHDSNARLSSLKSFFRTLKKYDLPEEILRLKEKAENDLMVIEGNHDAIIENKLADSSYTQEDLYTFFKQYKDLHKSGLDKDNIEFEIRQPVGTYHDDVWYAKGVLTGVIDRLLENSLEAFERNNISGAKKIIVIIDYGNYNVIWMDNAGGIDEAIKDKIFEEYVTSKHNINCSNSGGCGIGLFSAKNKMKMQGFDIELSAEPQEGWASFTLKFKI